MHYIFLKNIVQTILENHTCPECSAKPNEQSIKISGIAENTIDIHIHCPSCHVESHLNAQINTMATQMLESEQGRKFFDEFLKKGGTFGASMENGTSSSESAIKDEDIIKIHNDLKNVKSVEDLMK